MHCQKKIIVTQMEGDKFFTVDGVRYKCTFMYGYNSHYYGTVYNDESGRYIGQLVDIKIDDYNVEKRVTEFIKNNI